MVIQELQFRLQEEVGKIKKEIGSKCQQYYGDITMNNNWNVIEPKLQELKNKILTTDNYYTQQLTSKQIEELKRQTFQFDKENFVNFLQLLPGKIWASMDEAKNNIEKYCKETIQNNGRQSIKDLLKQLKNGPMQNNHIIYSTNMAGMTPSYMFERVDSKEKKSNNNLGKMYYEATNNQIEPLVKDKQKYQKTLREFESQLAKTEKKGSANDTPGLEGVKFHDIDDIERIQNEKIMKFVKEGKRNKNKLMGWIEVERNDFNEKFPEDNNIKKYDISNAKPEYALVTKIQENKKNINNNQPKVPMDNKQRRDSNNNNPMYYNNQQSIMKIRYD